MKSITTGADIRRRNIWGDSAFPYLFFVIKFLESRNEIALARTLLGELFVALTETNLPSYAT